MKPPKLKCSTRVISLVSALLISQASPAASGDKVHAFYADEHNTSSASTTGNRILEIDLDTMSLVNTLDVPGNLGHHADNGFNSKIYGVPKGSGFVNVIELEKDANGTTSMNLTKQIDLIHKPRSGDAYNKKFNVILMVASNRPMGSFINVETDEVVGTIGENIDCTLTDGTQLLSHADANTIAGATKYQCANADHGGDQISGHPYWLTSDYAAVVDRSNRQISVYHVQQDGTKLKSTLVNHLKTRTSVHQIVPRDRTNLPSNQQADFYAVEEGNIGDAITYGIPEALIKMKLTTSGLQLVTRMDLQRAQAMDRVKSDRILQSCKDIYFNDRSILYPPSIWFGDKGTWSFEQRKQAFSDLFAREGINPSNTSQSEFNDFPIECLHTGIPGGHNADFAPDNKRLFVGMAGGMMSVIDVDRMHLINNVDAGAKSGPGHTCFSKKHNVAIVSNHKKTHHRIIAFYDRAGINGRPTDGGRIELGNFNIISKEGLTDTYQSHTCYIDEEGENYYNFFTDGGVFYKIGMKTVGDWAYGRSKNRDFILGSIYTGGIPIQGSFISLKNIKDTVPTVQFIVNNDTAESDGNTITIDVLSNDTGDALTLEYVDGVNNGVVTIANGKAVYTPNQGFSGVDSFWYGASSPNLGWKWAYVEITVSSIQPPVVLDAKADTATTNAGQAVTIDVLANDTGTGIFIGVLDTANGGVVTKSAGQVIYTPNAGFIGFDDFWYEIEDAAGQTTWGYVTLNVTGAQVGIKANYDYATVTRGSSVTIDILANDTGSNINLFYVDTAWTGEVTRSGDNVVYTPAGSYTGDVEIWYGIEDPSGNESWGLITVMVQ